MNYGGSGTAGGNYGQHQMGMGQPQQMLNQQQQMQMGMGQQPPGGVPNPQQRMMMQGMRQHPGYPPGMMPGVQNVPMYPGSAQQSEIVKHWPPSWKAELQQEKNPEKRKIMMKRFFQQWEHICRQNPMYPPSVMGGQGMTPGAPHPGQMGMFPPQPGAMQPGAMPGMMNPMMAQQNKMMPGQQPGAMAMQMRMQGQMPGQAGPGSVQSMIPPSATPQPASVQQMSANMSVPSPSAALLGQSPQVINPSTPQNPASVQPGSIDVANPASQQDPDYIKLLIEFKKHGDMLKKVGERCDRDKKPLPKAYDKLLEIADEKRTVTKELLGRLLKTTQQILESNSLIHPVLEVCKMYSCQESASSPQKAEKEKTLLNPFSVVSQQFIRVPDEILENLEQEDVEFETAMKRKASEVTEVPTKRTRLDMETEKRTDSPPRIEIECMFGKNGKKWEMSEQATKELHSIPWKIDPDSVPPSYKCPDVTVCIDPQILIVPPLRVQIPVSYPEKNPVVQFDRSFPMSVQISAQLATLFERQLSKSESRSITAIFESYKIACEQMVRLGRSSHTLLTEKQHRQKLVV